MDNFNIENEKHELPFSVPEGYFEDLESKILAETVGTAPEKISLWKKVQPWMYAAAMIVGVMFITRAAVNYTRERFDQENQTLAQNEEENSNDSIFHQLELDDLSEDQLVELILASAE